MITWTNNLPNNTSLNQILYDCRRADGDNDLIMDSVTVADILADADEILVFDALVSTYARLERKMTALKSVMERSGGEIKPVAMQITDPFKQNGMAQIAAVFELSDGQTVSVFFHNPDVNPRKIAPADELISWRWLLNKRDITLLTAPERGRDLDVNTVASRVMQLAAKNSPAFQRANARRAERMQQIEDLKTEITGLEKELADAQHELEVAKVAYEERLAFNPISPAGYGKVMRDRALQAKFGEVLNKFFEWRINEVKNILRTIPGWIGDKKNLIKNVGEDTVFLTAKPSMSSNKIVGVHWNTVIAQEGAEDWITTSSIQDDLTKTPAQLASAIDAAAV